MSDVAYCQIYLSTNLINGRRYVGQSKSNNKHYYGSGNIVRMALKKYGRYNFKKEILWEGYTSSKSLNRLEILYIARYKTMEKFGGYNLVKGGLGHSHKIKGTRASKETRKKMSDARIGMKFSKEHKRNLAKAKIGTVQSAKHLAKRAINTNGTVISANGILYATQKVVSKYLNISISTLNRKLKNVNIKNILRVKFSGSVDELILE